MAGTAVQPAPPGCNTLQRCAIDHLGMSPLERIELQACHAPCARHAQSLRGEYLLQYLPGTAAAKVLVVVVACLLWLFCMVNFHCA
jgi:hypothetical protein